MPHIHTELDQHDMTVSGYVIFRENNEWKCLVHLHRKIEKLMQIGGHIELNETPWQSISHEIKEESGFLLKDLKILQYTKDIVEGFSNVTHPVPFSMNTHNVGNGHYHSDLCYGLVATELPKNNTAKGESEDLRWLTLDEINTAAKEGEVLQDVAHIYKFLIDHLSLYEEVPADKYSLDKPTDSSITYKRGAPGK